MLHVDQCSSLSLREQALQCIVVFALALFLREKGLFYPLLLFVVLVMIFYFVFYRERYCRTEGISSARSDTKQVFNLIVLINLGKYTEGAE